MTAAYPAAVIPVFVSAADALDHHDAPGVDYRFIFSGNLLSQIKVGQHPVILPIKVFGGFIFLGTNGDDGGAMLNLRHPSFGGHPGQEIADISGRLCDDRIRKDMD